MKISLNMNAGADEIPTGEVLNKLIQAAQSGDVQARDHLVQHFLPLLTSLAKKRGETTAEINTYIDRGKQGLLTAISKHKTSGGGDRFQVYALDFIERSMDGQSTGGFFARLFGK